MNQCKVCWNSFQKKWKESNLDKNKTREYNRKWRDSNKDRCIEYGKINRQKHSDKIKQTRLAKLAIDIADLSDRYVKARLYGAGYPTCVINNNPELIELKRLTLKFKRL